MILDEDGHWWMLGLESTQYHYDGQAWVPANPPSYEQRIRGSAVLTETGVQELSSRPPPGWPMTRCVKSWGEPGEESTLLRVPRKTWRDARLASHPLEPVRRSIPLAEGREVDAAANVITAARPQRAGRPADDQLGGSRGRGDNGAR